MISPRVAAIVVHYGPDAACVGCIRSVAASVGVSAFPIVVDHNAAPSAMLEEAVAALGGAYISNPANPGFAAGANAGMREADRCGTADLIVVLNPDVRLDPGCLLKLEEVCRVDPSIGIVGPGLLSASEPDTWWNAGSEIVWPSGKPRSLLHGLPRLEAAPEVVDAGFVCGSCMAFRPALLARCGFLREEYFLYFEDADFSLRARAAGLRTVVHRGALAWHSGGGSSSGLEAEAAYYRARNRLAFSRTWNPFPLRGRVYRGLFALRTVLRSLVKYAWSRRTDALLPTCAVFDHLRGASGKLRRNPCGRRGVLGG